MQKAQNISFHEAGITGVRSFPDGTLCVSLEGVYVDGEMRNASIRLKGVRQIVRDGSPAESFTMEYEDGEVLTLEKNSDSLRLIIEWNDFEHHRHTTRSYQILCDSTDIELA
jgi:hypothetical protein